MAQRVEVTKSDLFFGETRAIINLVKANKYGPDGSKRTHRDFKFIHIIPKPTNYSFLIARVLEKPDRGVLKWVRESDRKVFLIPIEKGELLIMMAHAGLCLHKCERGPFTVVTDFVLPHSAVQEEYINNGGLDGKFEKMICDFAKGICVG